LIEFKQIIGRGTRLYEGKAYFTIYDFVKAYHHFNDPEWDGEPDEPTGISRPSGPSKPRDITFERPAKIRVKLRDGKERMIQSMAATLFLGPDGKPVSAAQFLENLFGTLPEFFKNEDELRTIWSVPETRKAFLLGLAEKGYGHDVLLEMQRIINAENSDLFDVLAYVAFALQPISRTERAEQAKVFMAKQFTDKQEIFLNFVLAQYVQVGVEELDIDQLSPLLRLRYHDALSDAFKDLGEPAQVRKVFSGFQKYIYLLPQR
jgi:type I restriction enzyme R subunit